MARFVVGIGQTAVARDPADTIEMIGLGSCAGIFVVMPGVIAVAAHSLLAQPREGEDPTEPGKYVETAVPFVVDEITKAGIAKARCRSWVVGGAQMFTFGGNSDSAGIGDRNTELATELLRKAGFRPDTSFVGGTSARRAALSLESGELVSSNGNGG
jgi:chemotaxis protein CheD